MKWQATKDTYKVVVGEPSVIFQGEEGDHGWGKHCFPSLKYTVSGKIRVRWAYGEDRIGVVAKSLVRLSEDGGKTWTVGDEAPRYTVQMKNGKYFAGFNRRPTARNVDLSGYTPGVTWSNHRDDISVYILDEVKDAPTMAAEHVGSLSLYEYDPETGKTEEIPCTFHWPYAPIVQHYQRDKGQSHTLPISDLFGISYFNTISVDGTLYICIYANGFDSTAKTREEAVSLKASTKYSTYVFVSEDSGRHWEFLSQVNPDQIPDMKTRVKNEKEASYEPEGPCEPKMIRMPDGSFFMLLRTGHDNPLYAVRSEDNCRSWSEPFEFFEYGVLPQILTMDCGVTLTSFGRPDLWMRYTFDPTGAEWEAPVQIPLAFNGRENMWSNSCCYTNLLPLSDKKALLVYADFKYPNENGVGVRSIITREITVEKK